MNLDDIEKEEREEIENNKKQKKKISIFRRTQKEKPDFLPEDEYKGTDIKGFFIKLRIHFREIIYLNLLYVFGNFPLFFILVALSGAFKIDFYTPSSDVFTNLYSSLVATTVHSPLSLIDFATESTLSQVTAMTLPSYIFIALSCLIIFTFGPITVGVTYILRNIIKGEPVFLWSDFKSGIKKNFKQSFAFGIFDAIIHILIPFNIVTMYMNASSLQMSILFYLTIIFSIIYIVMRYYIYLQMVTFKLSIWKILKNSLIFVVLGVKRNTVAFIGIAFCVFIEFLILFGAGGVLMPLAIAFPLCFLISFCMFIKIYAAYYKMKEIMIDPYYDDEGNPI